MWDHNYRRLDEGEIVEYGDQCQNDDGSWSEAIVIGDPAPDPSYTSHRVYRRLRLRPWDYEKQARNLFAFGCKYLFNKYAAVGDTDGYAADPWFKVTGALMDIYPELKGVDNEA